MSDLTCMGISKVNDMDLAEILRIMANQRDLGFLDDIRKTGRLPMKRATLEQIKAYHAHRLQSCPAQSQKPNDPPLQGENEDRQTHTQANDNDTLSYVFEGVAKNIQVERKDGSGDFEDAIRPDGTHWNQSPLPKFKSPGPSVRNRSEIILAVAWISLSFPEPVPR
ncbi:hypothetical protein GT037_005031 [Alternaria burnsii]|uniref:Uncharacterized protein n=1 Tax=Alternaria burnsii TaxID=1187904 RepID=A0A8H7B8Z7_9PLEO|nr:uncharacterized protein GT037_005031 [Alternaria burnsii]KAF7676819.1 hypothetical protein GT037_005031 [Alternaria burnsii]